MRIQQNNERGSVLVTTIIVMGCVTLLVAALLTIVRHQHNLSARSTTWCSEIPIAEAGIEEAMAHLCARPKKLWTNGWTLSGSNVVKTRYFTNTPGTPADGYFYTVISTSIPPQITSIGYGRIPTASASSTNNYTRRSVFVTTKMNAPPYGIVAKETIDMNGGPWVDSFDPTDSDYSTGGQYDPLKRRDQAGVATLSTAVPAIITGNGEIWGYASTGPGGTVTGTVGDGIWNTTTSGIQPLHTRNDFNIAIPNVEVPIAATWITTWPVGKALTNKKFYKFSDLNGSFTVNGDVVLWVTGDVKLTGGDVVAISPGGSLQLYIGNTNGPSVSADFGGNGIVNGTGLAKQCQIWGLPTCIDMEFHGSVEMIAAIYAPQADVRMTGTSDIYGSFVGKSFRCSGAIGIHQDESLIVKGPPFTIISWEEL